MNRQITLNNEQPARTLASSKTEGHVPEHTYILSMILWKYIE